MPKAYIMVMYRSAPEPTTFAQYGELAIPAVHAAGGRLLARGMPAKTYEAGMNERVTLIEFDSLEQAVPRVLRDVSPGASACKRRARVTCRQ